VGAQEIRIISFLSTTDHRPPTTDHCPEKAALGEQDRAMLDFVVQTNVAARVFMRKVMKIAIVVVTVYGLLLGGFYLAMSQSPDVFNKVMAKAPSIVFMAFPFKPMWMSARGGRLRVGDAAPDFQLETYDKKASVRLSDWKGKKPVVLVFGSYT
jgi:hypothetical protein